MQDNSQSVFSMRTNRPIRYFIIAIFARNKHNTSAKTLQYLQHSFLTLTVIGISVLAKKQALILFKTEGDAFQIIHNQYIRLSIILLLCIYMHCVFITKILCPLTHAWQCIYIYISWATHQDSQAPCHNTVRLVQIQMPIDNT